MGNLLIKRWNTADNDWEKLSPKVTYTDIVADVTAGTPVSIFQSGKLKLDYLPDAVFDSLKFQSTLSTSLGTAALADYFIGAVSNASSNNRSVIGYYFAASNSGSISQQTIAVAGSLNTTEYVKWTFENNDAGAQTPTSSGTLESGDWIVIEQFSGAGTSGDPYVLVFGVVNNVYEVMSGANGTVAGAQGLVPAPGASDNTKFLKGDGTWATPTNTNTTYEISAVDGTSGKKIIRLTDSNAGTDDVTLVQGNNVTLTRSGDEITIASSYTDTDTTYTHSWVDSGDNAILRLTAGGDGSGNDDLTIVAGTNVTLTPSGDNLTIDVTTIDYSAGVGLVEDNDDTFKMQYPMFISATEQTAYKVAGAMWFDIS